MQETETTYKHNVYEMRQFKFGNRHIYEVPGVDHLFSHEQDAVYYCDEHGIDRKTIVKYDSRKEYNRWLELKKEEADGKISFLERQVEYVLIPERRETVWVKDKVVKKYALPSHGAAWGTRKEAVDFCRERKIPYKAIEVTTETVPVYKEVVIEQKAVYTADFVYVRDGVTVVEDVKSEITRKEADYVLRRKLMLHVWNIRILET